MRKKMGLGLILLCCLSLCACSNNKYAKYDELIGYIEAGNGEKAYAELIVLLQQNVKDSNEKESGEESEKEDDSKMQELVDRLCDEWELRDSKGTIVFQKDGTYQWDGKTGIYTVTWDKHEADMLRIKMDIDGEEYSGRFQPLSVNNTVLSLNNAYHSLFFYANLPLEKANTKEKYEYAVKGIKDHLADPYGYTSERNGTLEKLYEIFVEIGDYEDAKSYLNGFVLQKDMFLYREKIVVDAFGQETRNQYNGKRYDIYGNQIEADPSNNGGLPTEFVYDGKKLINVTYVDTYNNNKLLAKRTYEYNEAGQLVKSSFVTLKNHQSETIYTYNAQGKLVLEHTTVIESDGDVYNYSYTNTYDDKGNLVVREYKIDQHTYDQYKEISIYDEQNRLVEMKIYRIDRPTQQLYYEFAHKKYTYEYNADGTVLFKTHEISNTITDEYKVEETYSYKDVIGTYYIYQQK